MTDDIDKRLMMLLKQNARQSNRALAEQLKVSRVTIQGRIRKLIDNEVIRITVLFDPRRLGTPVGVIIGLDVTHRRLDEVMDMLSEKEPIARVSKSTGRFNILAVAMFASIDEVSDFVFNVLTKMDGIKHSETFVLLTIKQARNKETRETVDAIDQQLIRLLQRNGRHSTVALSRQLNVSPTTVQRRIRRLIDEGVIRIVASINQGKVGWFRPAAVGICVNPNCLAKVLHDLSRHPAVSFVSCTTGRYDIFASIESESREGLYELVEEQLAHMEDIKDYELFISEQVKYGPIWSGSGILSRFR